MISQGNVIGAVVAVDQATAQRAAKLVKVNYEDLSPVIITIEVSKNFFYPIYFNQFLGRNPREIFHRPAANCRKR